MFRVGKRTGRAPGKTPLEGERKLEKVVPAERKLHAHHWLILHGRYVCKARRPDCFACVVNDLCAFKAKTTLELPPRKPAKQPPKKTAGGRVLGKQAKAARSEEHTSELQSLMRISYAVFCLKKKKRKHTTKQTN